MSSSAGLVVAIANRDHEDDVRRETETSNNRSRQSERCASFDEILSNYEGSMAVDSLADVEKLMVLIDEIQPAVDPLVRSMLELELLQKLAKEKYGV